MSPSKNDTSSSPVGDRTPSPSTEDALDVPLPLNTQLVVPVNGTLVEEHDDYLVVSWDLDTTGRRLIDEICQIGG
jgi:hypothetical protein